MPTNEDGSPARPMKLIEVATPFMTGRAYHGPGGLRVLAARELGEWHISVSAVGRYPSWDELRDVCWALRPERQFKVIVPPRGADYLNEHPFCIHLWEDR